MLCLSFFLRRQAIPLLATEQDNVLQHFAVKHLTEFHFHLPKVNFRQDVLT